MRYPRGVRVARIAFAAAAAAAAVAVAALAACKAEPSPAEVAEAGWHAHELVIAAGERAASCADAGAAMEKVFADHRGAFVAALQLDQDKARLQAATDYLEAHGDRYADLETRMEALSDRCAADKTVQAVFHEMELPE